MSLEITIKDSAEVRGMVAALCEHIVELSTALEKVCDMLDECDDDRGERRCRTVAPRALLAAPDIAERAARFATLATAVKQLDDAKTHEEHGLAFNALAFAAREAVR